MAKENPIEDETGRIAREGLAEKLNQNPELVKAGLKTAIVPNRIHNIYSEKRYIPRMGGLWKNGVILITKVLF